MDGPDGPRLAGVVPQGAAELVDGIAQHLVADMGIGPDRVENLPFGEGLADVLGEVTEHLERLLVDALALAIGPDDGHQGRLDPMGTDPEVAFEERLRGDGGWHGARIIASGPGSE